MLLGLRNFEVHFEAEQGHPRSKILENPCLKNCTKFRIRIYFGIF